MKTLSSLILLALAIQLCSGEIKQSYFGLIESLSDCEQFNATPGKNYARASVSAAGSPVLSRGTWKILGNATKFAVEDCYKKITDPKKIIIFTVSKDFDKLKVFPRGPGWLQIKVAKGPNAPLEPEHVPTALDDGSFKAVVFGFAEAESGADTGYTKEQVNKLIRMHDAAEVRAERFIFLNHILLQNSSSNVLRPIMERNGPEIIVYQDGPESDMDLGELKARFLDRNVNLLNVKPQDPPATPAPEVATTGGPAGSAAPGGSEQPPTGGPEGSEGPGEITEEPEGESTDGDGGGGGGGKPGQEPSDPPPPQTGGATKSLVGYSVVILSLVLNMV